MGQTLEPATALEPEAVTSLYLGALGLEDPDRRLAAAQTVLCLGRLGLRPGELLHFHAGWIDWELGELRVPEHDDCACELCWERARVAQRAGDGRPLADIVAEDAWAGTPRAIPFGWAPRLSAVLATAVDTWEYLDYSADDLRGLLDESAERATGVDRDAVDFGGLRAAAAAFFADAGFDAPRVADVMGIDVETAAEFTAQQPGRARTHLYQAFDANPPATAGQADTYPLLSDPEPLENEPFDPTDFDAGWRTARAADAGDGAEGSPRPPVEPTGDTSPADPPEPSPAVGESADSAPVDESSPAVAGEAAVEVDELRNRVTPPVEYTVNTRFAASKLLEGRPAGGQLCFGQSEFVVGAHGEGEFQATLVVPYDAVRDVAVEWAPDRLAEMFEETVGLAVEPPGDERQTLVVEIPDGQRETFLRTLFEGLLGEIGAIVRHPATIKDQVTDAEPGRHRVAVTDGRIDVGVESGRADPSIAMADVVDVERKSLTVDGEVRHGLRLEHIQRDGKRVGTYVAPGDERTRQLLERYVVADLRDRERRAAEADLSSDEHDVLDALETNPGRRDLGKLLDMEGETLTDVLDALAAAGLVHVTEDGVRLSGMGRLHLGGATPDLDA